MVESNCVIETMGLTKKFRDFWGHTRVIAVDQLDLRIYEGEVFGLLGPNGSGKSTTIKMLLGLLNPSRGLSKVLGQPPGDVKMNKRIGYLPEESYLYPYLNARETLDFYGRIFGLSRAERKSRIDSLIEMVGLTGNTRRPVAEFSKGMMRRIGLAQSLINDPDLLILDEPTSGLDPLGTRQIKELIVELGQRGKTILLCSHLLADVEDVCSRVGIMYGGKLHKLGTLDELLSKSESTQIETKHLSPEAIEKIKEIIQDDQIEIQVPKEKLEDYFLRIVEQAQSEKVATSGALIGGQVSDFLGSAENKPTDMISDLVKGKELSETTAQSDQATTTPITPTKTVDKNLLSSLTKDDKAANQTVPVTSEDIPQEPDKPQVSVDHNLIDQLTDQPDKPAEDSQDDDAEKDR